MCAIDLKPISIVEGPGFKFFAHSLNPLYKMPCRKTVGKYLEKIYEEEKADLIETLSGHPVALTSDLWTSNALEGYIGLTGHFISKNWELYAKVLATRHVRNRHTGENIAHEIKNLIKEFKIDLCAGLVTDNAANMSVAADKLGLRHVGCFAHTLQLAIEDGLKVPQIAKTLTVSRQLVSHFNHSLLATNALLNKQTSTPKLKLVQDIQTRWNSSFYMLQRLLKLRVPIYTVIFDEAITKVGDRARLDIKDSYWKIIEDVIPILEPLADITEVLGKENEPTASAVYVLLFKVFNQVLCHDLGESSVIKDLKVKIKEGLQKRFKVDSNGAPVTDIIASSPLLLASVLDPRYKSLLGREILNSEQKELLHENLIQFVRDTSSVSLEPVKQNTNENPPEKRCKILDVLKGDFGDLTTPNATNKSLEFECYLRESVTIGDPLQWWKVCEPKFPRIAKAAKIFLSIPATSISSERTFSAAGLTVNNLRSSLDPETVDHIVFVNKNVKSGVKKLIASSFGTQENEMEKPIAMNFGTHEMDEPATASQCIPDEVEVSGEIELSDLPYEVKKEVLSK